MFLPNNLGNLKLIKPGIIQPIFPTQKLILKHPIQRLIQSLMETVSQSSIGISKLLLYSILLDQILYMIILEGLKLLLIDDPIGICMWLLGVHVQCVVVQLDWIGLGDLDQFLGELDVVVVQNEVGDIEEPVVYVFDCWVYWFEDGGDGFLLFGGAVFELLDFGVRVGILLACWTLLIQVLCLFFV